MNSSTQSLWRKIRADMGVSKRQAKRLARGNRGISRHVPAAAPVALYRQLSIAKRRSQPYV